MHFIFAGDYSIRCTSTKREVGWHIRSIRRFQGLFTSFRWFNLLVSQVHISISKFIVSFIFSGAEYSLSRHNCNNFSEELAQFLCGVSIPKYILELPDILLSTPLGQTLRPLIEQLEGSAQHLPINQPVASTRPDSPEFVELNSEIEKVRSETSERK